MDAIDKAFTELGAAIEGFKAATIRVRDARDALNRALDGAAVADSPTSSEAPKPAMARAVKAPAPKPKATAAPAPKAASKPAPAPKADPDAPRPRGVWTEPQARLLWPALTPEWQARFRKLLGGPVPVAKLFPGESRPGPLFAGLTHKSRAATHINSSPVITEDGTARLADGLDVALRAAGIVP